MLASFIIAVSFTYTITMIVLLGSVIVAFFVYRKKRHVEVMEELHMTETKKDILEEANIDEEVVLEEEVRPLTTMDASMIKARIEKLELVVHLEQQKQERMYRKVLDMCKKGTVGLWWEPLAWFSRNLRTKDDKTIIILNSKRIMLSTVANINDSLSVITRLGEIHFMKIDPPGEEFEFDADDLLIDGEYRMIYSRRDKKGSFPVLIKDRKFDIIGWFKEVNNILRKVKIPHRFLIMAPNKDTWCIVYTPIGCTQRAIKSKWGVV